MNRQATLFPKQKDFSQRENSDYSFFKEKDAKVGRLVATFYIQQIQGFLKLMGIVLCQCMTITTVV